MTYAQVADEAKRLTPAEKLELVETLLRDLRWTITNVEPSATSQPLSTEDKLRVVHQLGGILKARSGDTTDDDQIRESYTDYLIRKYLSTQQ